MRGDVIGFIESGVITVDIRFRVIRESLEDSSVEVIIGETLVCFSENTVLLELLCCFACDAS